MIKTETPKFFHRIRKPRQKTIKIGLLGNDFNASKEARLIYSYFGLKDKKISATVFCLNASDEITAHLKEQNYEWFDLKDKTAIEIAKKIYDEKIDVLFALSDNEKIRETLKYHPAPMQIAGANALSLKDVFDKNNIPLVEAVLGDNFITAAEGIETIKFNSAFCYLPFFGNANLKKEENKNEMVFGAIYHENDKRLPCWKVFFKILDSVPNSKLQLFSDCFDDEKNKIIAKKRLAWAGISEDKIEAVSVTSKDSFDYLSKINIFLDSYPNGEQILLLDALYMGIPIVSMTDTGKSILNAIGLSELAPNDEEAYVNSTVAISKDGELLNALKTGLRNMMESSFIMNKEDFLEILKSAVFASFDYLMTLKDNVPNDEEFKILWDIFHSMDAMDNNKFALLDRILLARPKDPEELNYISIILPHDEVENIKDAIEYLPDNTLAKEFAKLAMVYKAKKWNETEKMALEVRKIIPKDESEKYIISTAIHMLADTYKATGRFKMAAKSYLECEEMTPLKNKSNVYERYSNYLLMLHYTDTSPKEMFEEAKNYANLFKNIVKFPHEKIRKKKIRVGYISADFRNHVVANFSAAFFQARNPERFETFAYMTQQEDSNTNFFKKIADNYKNLNKLKYDEAAKVIYNDKIDILVDLGGHTGDNPLPILARKPAPIQVSGIGYFSSTGLPEVDYFIVDEHTAPKGEDEFFTEKLIRLKHSHFCLTHTKMRPHILEQIPFERNNFITFGSMNKTDKATDTVLETWKKIMDKVPNSRLFLKYGTYDDPWRLTKERQRMAEMGFDLKRVVFEGFSHQYLARYNAMDIALDTFPYPGGGTTCDALMMNVPVVTLSGKSNHERFGKSILENIGLDEYIAYNLDEYVDIAVNLANDIPRLKGLHNEIFDRMKHSAIMDQSIYMKDLEEAYEKIYEDYMSS